MPRMPSTSPDRGERQDRAKKSTATKTAETRGYEGPTGWCGPRDRMMNAFVPVEKGLSPSFGCESQGGRSSRSPTGQGRLEPTCGFADRCENGPRRLGLGPGLGAAKTGPRTRWRGGRANETVSAVERLWNASHKVLRSRMLNLRGDHAAFHKWGGGQKRRFSLSG